MGEATSGPIQLSFNPQLRVEFRGATVTSDAGLLLPRELDSQSFKSLQERKILDDVNRTRGELRTCINLGLFKVWN